MIFSVLAIHVLLLLETRLKIPCGHWLHSYGSNGSDIWMLYDDSRINNGGFLFRHVFENQRVTTMNVGKTLRDVFHPPVITIFRGDMITIPSHGWFMVLSYHHENCGLWWFYHLKTGRVGCVLGLTHGPSKSHGCQQEIFMMLSGLETLTKGWSAYGITLWIRDLGEWF